MTDERMEYLESLAEDFGADIEDVLAIAELLGEGEDEDGLLTALEDMMQWTS